MTFIYDNEDRTDALDRAMGDKSFYALLADSNQVYARVLKHFTDYKKEFGKHTISEGTTQFLSVLELFNNLLGDTDDKLDDDKIAAELFANHRDATREITGCNTAGDFKTSLSDGILAAAAAYRETLAALRQSFKLTYRHKDIVALLAATKVVTKQSLVKSRVFETAYVLDRILDKKRFLATSLLLGIMHVERFKTYLDADTKRPFYNQGSALFTLLTFSYTPASSVQEVVDYARDNERRFQTVLESGQTTQAALLRELEARIEDKWAKEVADKGVDGVKAELKRWKKTKDDKDAILTALKKPEVQYGWKIFGSCLGIDNALLPTTYGDAGLLWRQFANPSYPRVVSDDDKTVQGRSEMLDTFNQALAVKTVSDAADFASFGITLKASAVTEMGWFGPVARIVGWYTSSNHAGYTCSVCKTVHGSRVSLVRLWHRCPKCAIVTCAHCASGMKLYAALAVGTAVGVAGGWWWAAGAKLYAAAFGGIAASGSGHAVSKFLSRTCRECHGETEALY